MELHGREMADEFCLKMPDFHVTFRDLLHAVNLRHGADGFTSPPKEGVLRIFFALKNPTASVGFEPANLGTKGHYCELAYMYTPDTSFSYRSSSNRHAVLITLSDL